MRKSIGVGAFALASSAFLLAACGTPYYYPTSSSRYYERPYYAYSSAYDDCYGRYRAAYCDYPRYNGTVIIAGDSYRGLRYRMGPYGREFWFGGQWVRA